MDGQGNVSIVLLAAGAGGMYCGSCLRDNALAAAMMRAEGDPRVLLVPLYTPLRTDEPDVSTGDVLYGGVNVFLEQACGLFRHTPRAVDWVFDRRALLKAAGRFAADTSSAKIGVLTASILSGRHGGQRKQLRRLLGFLRRKGRPDAVILPNAMFLGLAQPIIEELGAPVLCELTGEDVFLDSLPEPWCDKVRLLIRSAAKSVSRFIATSKYYAGRMAEYLAVPPERIDVVYAGISAEGLSPDGSGQEGLPPSVAYMARLCPEKGLDLLMEAVIQLRRLPGGDAVRVQAAGSLPRTRRDREWFEALTKRIAGALRPETFTCLGEVDRAGKGRLLQSADVLCVPTARPEPKAMFVLEGWACGLPFVGFDHGAFGELLAAAGTHETPAGVLVKPGDTTALAEALSGLLQNRARCRAMGQVGQTAVLEKFTADHMARGVLQTVKQAMGR